VNQKKKGNPVVGFPIRNREAYEVLVERAKRAGLGPHAYAGSIFNALWEQIARMDVSLEDTRSLVVSRPEATQIDSDAERLKDWFWEFYEALPPDRRHDIIRGLADRFNYPNPPRVHAEGEHLPNDSSGQERRSHGSGRRKGAL